MQHVPLTAGQALAEQIIANHTSSSERSSIAPGDSVSVDVDLIYVQDGNAPTVAKLFRDHGFEKIFDPSRVHFIFDHSVLPPNREMATKLKEAEEFANRHDIHLQRRGSGISHVIAAEQGWFSPGTLVLGSDSHTCTGGAYGSMALGMGASDITAAIVTGQTWLRVPETLTIQVNGSAPPYFRARDLFMYLLRTYGQSKFLYKSLEIAGYWAEKLKEDEAASIASLSVELGAKCCFIANPHLQIPAGTDENCEKLVVDLSAIQPHVAQPHQPSNSGPLDKSAGTAIDYVFLGSCTSSRLSDLKDAAAILRDSKVSSRVQMVVTPGSLTIYKDAIRLGYIETLVDAGALITPPGCGACVGTQGPIPADGDKVLSTMNRNFRGRMGNPTAEIFLASAPVAAATAITGKIPNTEELNAICENATR